MSAGRKAAIYLLVIVVLAAGIIFWLGSKKHQIRIDQTINAPPDVVFKHLTEPDLIKEWADGIVSIEPLTKGGHEKGARAKIVVEENGQRFEVEDEVKESQKNERLMVESKATMFVINSDYHIEPTGDNTSLRLVVEMQHKGIFCFLAPFMSGSISDKVKEDVIRLKQSSEKNFENGVVKSNPESYQKNKADIDEKKNDTVADDQNKKASIESKSTDGKLRAGS